jgi:5-methylcytosine-specific restriction endonuclease McrA
MRYCATPGCTAVVERGHCGEHARARDRARGTAQERQYTYQWATYSQVFRTLHPFCGERSDGSLDYVHSRCVQRGLETPTQCVDHIVPLSQGGSLWDTRNHLALCTACNIWKALTIERGARHG